MTPDPDVYGDPSAEMHALVLLADEVANGPLVMSDEAVGDRRRLAHARARSRRRLERVS
jgi:hypothetical protein